MENWDSVNFDCCCIAKNRVMVGGSWCHTDFYNMLALCFLAWRTGKQRLGRVSLCDKELSHKKFCTCISSKCRIFSMSCEREEAVDSYISDTIFQSI